MSLPYPEPGLRLIRQDKIDGFDAQMAELKDELEEAVLHLGEHYAELKSAARDRLGSRLVCLFTNTMGGGTPDSPNATTPVRWS